MANHTFNYKFIDFDRKYNIRYIGNYNERILANSKCNFKKSREIEVKSKVNSLK